MTLAEALIGLDLAVSADGLATARSTQLRQQWTDAVNCVERFASGRETYCLSVGSYVSYSVRDRWCVLQREAGGGVRDRFELALPERRAVERIVAEWLDGPYEASGG